LTHTSRYVDCALCIILMHRYVRSYCTHCSRSCTHAGHLWRDDESVSASVPSHRAEAGHRDEQNGYVRIAARSHQGLWHAVREVPLLASIKQAKGSQINLCLIDVGAGIWAKLRIDAICLIPYIHRTCKWTMLSAKASAGLVRCATILST